MLEARWVFVFLGAMALLAMAMPAVRAAAIDGDVVGITSTELAGERLYDN